MMLPANPRAYLPAIFLNGFVALRLRCDQGTAERLYLAVPAPRVAALLCSYISNLKKRKPSNGFRENCCFPPPACQRGMCSWVTATRGTAPCWSTTNAPFMNIALRPVAVMIAGFLPRQVFRL